jgi:hypothetical protein
MVVEIELAMRAGECLKMHFSFMLKYVINIVEKGFMWIMASIYFYADAE